MRDGVEVFGQIGVDDVARGQVPATGAARLRRLLDLGLSGYEMAPQTIEIVQNGLGTARRRAP